MLPAASCGGAHQLTFHWFHWRDEGAVCVCERERGGRERVEGRGKEKKEKEKQFFPSSLSFSFFPFPLLFKDVQDPEAGRRAREPQH